jgi:cyclin-dependent kinase regulatory subunit CKS1
VQQSRGWVHYEFHRPEPHILLFRRELGTDPVTGKKPTAA